MSSKGMSIRVVIKLFFAVIVLVSLIRKRKDEIQMIRIGLIGELNQETKAHVAIPQALELAGHELAYQFEAEWLATPHWNKRLNKSWQNIKRCGLFRILPMPVWRELFVLSDIRVSIISPP